MSGNLLAFALPLHGKGITKGDFSIMNKPYAQMSRAELTAELSEQEALYGASKEKHYQLDMSRGKPSDEQLDLPVGLNNVLSKTNDFTCRGGIDCRNYGLLDGIPEIKEMFADILEVPTDNIIVCGNSSLNIMYDTVVRCLLYGVPGGEPWSKQGEIRFLCPAPGYDRHFAICESLGIQMIPVRMTSTGPDMDEVEKLVESDPHIKGIWCVPKYSNPDGITYSEQTVRRFAALRPAAPDFRIFWDNAYVVHDLEDTTEPLCNLFELIAGTKNENIAYEFVSTSKITFPGSGVAAIASSHDNIAQIKSIMSVQTIGHDKMNMLRHVRFFGNADGVRAHMKKHAAILRPRFDLVLNTFARELGPTQTCKWHTPRGGYFISLYVPNGCAKEVYRLASECGIKLTPAGATYPYGKDPDDSNLRIAPTYPTLEELRVAVDVLCNCIKIAALRKLLSEETI